MKLYDETITQVQELLQNVKSLEGKPWKDVGDFNMILRSDAAYELGDKKGVGLMALSEDSELVSGDFIGLIGKDLSEIKGSGSYARITFIRVDKDALGEGNSAFNAINKLDYVRYHLNPEGYMIRISPLYNKEEIRVSKDAVRKGISFSHIGQMFLDAYHRNPVVKGVQIYFVTDPEFDYVKVLQLSDKCEKITKAIDHITKNVLMDCGSCSLKPVCDEVEGMKELHFGSQ